MPRRLLTLVTAGSLAMCAATCVLWARSYGYRDGVEFDRDGTRWGVEPVDGRLVLSDAPQRRLERAAADADLLAVRQERRREMDRLGDLFAASRLEREPSSSAAVEREAEIRRVTAVWLQATRKETAVRVRSAAVAGVAVNARSVPLVLPMAAFGLAPAAWLAVQARAGQRYRRRRAANLCPACGYDLRGTPEQGAAVPGRCPECGPLPAVRNVGLTGRHVALVFVSASLAAAGLYAFAATTGRPTTSATATPATSRPAGPSARTTRPARPPPVQVRIAPATSARINPWPPEEMDRMKAYFELRDLSGGRDLVPDPR